jgi:glycosyltransferase involved in cell wall biosynthesis
VRLCQQHLGRSPILIRSIAEVVPPRAAAPEAFLWIGRVVRMKRPEAYLELARTVSEAQFFMVAVASDQPEHAELFREVERAAATIPNLTLLPPRPRNELMAVLDRTVAVVSTSDFEGMPNTFLEGWARGIPALALSHDPDGIIERYGLGACAAGSAEVLAEHARRFWQTRKDFGELATRCRSYVEEHHSPHSVGARWEQVLRAGAGAHSSRRRSTSSS